MDTGGVIGGGGPGGRKPKVREITSPYAVILLQPLKKECLLKQFSVPGGKCIGLNPGRKNGGGGGGGTPGPKPGGGIPRGGVKAGGWRAPTTGGPG